MIAEHGVNALLLHGQLPKNLRDERMTAAPEHQLIIGTLSLLSEGNMRFAEGFQGGFGMVDAVLLAL